MKNAVYFQSGGPTSVINTSLYGAIKAFQESNLIDKFYGSKFGIEGILNHDVIEFNKEEDYSFLKKIPSAILGSSRKKIDFNNDELMNKVLTFLKENSIHYIFVNGGNDSMDTGHQLVQYLNKVEYPCSIIGIPKTIDNDLDQMDFTPGFSSAVNYVVRTIMELNLDTRVYKKGRVTVVETMGRDAGWLALSSCLANDYQLGPDLIYIPEISFSIDQFLKDVENIYNKKHRVLVCVSEALKDCDGQYLFSNSNKVDAFGHIQLGSISKKLCEIIEDRLNLKTRYIEFSLMQRCSANLISKLDQEVAYQVGYNGVKFALEGLSGVICIKSSNDDISYILSDFVKVANVVKTVPLNYVNETKNGVSKIGKVYFERFKDDTIKFDIPDKFLWE